MTSGQHDTTLLDLIEQDVRLSSPESIQGTMEMTLALDVNGRKRCITISDYILLKKLVKTGKTEFTYGDLKSLAQSECMLGYNLMDLVPDFLRKEGENYVLKSTVLSRAELIEYYNSAERLKTLGLPKATTPTKCPYCGRLVDKAH